MFSKCLEPQYSRKGSDCFLPLSSGCHPGVSSCFPCFSLCPKDHLRAESKLQKRVVRRDEGKLTHRTSSPPPAPPRASRFPSLFFCRPVTHNPTVPCPAHVNTKPHPPEEPESGEPPKGKTWTDSPAGCGGCSRRPCVLLTQVEILFLFKK